MSMEMRQALVNNPNLKFSYQCPSARADLLDDDPITGTSSYLVETLTHVVSKYPFELTDVRTGHHDDGPHGHYGGFAADGWPLVHSTLDDWLSENDPEFQAFLQWCAEAPNLYQLGLGGTSRTKANFAAAGKTAFDDNDQDHVHIGSHDDTF